MNATQEYIEQRKAICEKEWFKDHQAALIAQQLVVDDAAVIEWKKPGRWNYGMRFIIHRFWLIVVGDLGEAVYGWGQDVTLDFLAQINFDYFHGKCVASETGREFTMFNRELGYKLACEWLTNNPGAHEEIHNLGPTLAKEEVADIASRLYQRTGDSEIASMITGWYESPHVRAIAHFVGLQMAIKQLRTPVSVAAQ